MAELLCANAGCFLWNYGSLRSATEATSKINQAPVATGVIKISPSMGYNLTIISLSSDNNVPLLSPDLAVSIGKVTQRAVPFIRADFLDGAVFSRSDTLTLAVRWKGELLSNFNDGTCQSVGAFDAEMPRAKKTQQEGIVRSMGNAIAPF